MTNINATTTAQPAQLSTCPQDKAFCLSAAFNLPARGKRLTVAFTAAVTYGDRPTG